MVIEEDNMITFKIESNGKKFRNCASMNATCNCGSCNCNCGSQLISTDINSQFEKLIK